ncbi:rhodanese-like domain-containing protein [Maritalea porphyrae]|jgi:rhodanese-related sulfurtransferase|uniref:rhodanese-like domain-containing protein n=1 Tax=Maritalea porphyrae TaxID=880732 RepID=UPI0022AFA527|nr:rhodanese-like domain-containing protein [Maritalea porphyrae]MCZ4271800.1 rhodanese-like domain-containing protein [Maritalea porphyrae]
MKTVKQLVDQAMAEIETLDVESAKQQTASGKALLVDLRDIRELKREGKIEGAVHVPRGMLEFWIDPTSLYHKPELATDKKLVFFCAAGWRSALATKTAKDMGFENVAHIEGGFGGWRDAGAPIVEPETR